MQATSNASPDRIPFLDDMRGFAIISVFLFHCMRRSLGYELSPTLGGVALFFVLSGFCIHLTCRGGAGKSWRDFYVLRFFRIYPAYAAAILFFAFIFPTTRLRADWTVNALQLGSHLLLIHNANASTFFGINPALWSIAIEAQFYLLYPLLLALVAALGWKRVLWLLAAVALALRYFGAVDPSLHPWRSSTLDGLPFFHWFSWALGAAVADAYLNGREAPLARSPLTLWLLAAVVTALIRPIELLSFMFASLLTAAAIGRLLATGRRSIPGLPNIVSRHLKFAGAVSYSFYLLHLPLIIAGARLLEKQGFDKLSPPLLLAVLLTMYLPILASTALFSKYIEMPSAAWGKKLLKRRSQRRADTSPILLSAAEAGADTAGVDS
jgi:peptidoglycan/LPS O-acetylase OafA/YrhL